MKATIGKAITLENVPRGCVRELESVLTLTDPEYAQAEKAGRSTSGLLPVVKYFAKLGPDSYRIPRAALHVAQDLASRHGLELEIVDTTTVLPAIDLEFQGRLRIYQIAALADILREPCAVLDSPTGSGKTVIALAAIAARKQPATVIVHTKLLLEQWTERISRFLDLERDEIGFAANGQIEIGEVTVCLINTLYRAKPKELGDLARETGHLVVDECHRAITPSYSGVLREFGCRFRLGLSATPYRRDTLGPAIPWLLGPIRRVAKGPLYSSGAVLPAEIEQRETDFTTDLDGSENYQGVLSELVADFTRARQIVGAIREELDNQEGTILVLADRVAYLVTLASFLTATSGLLVLHGQLKAKEKREAVSRLESGDVRVIFATVQLVGEGWDFPAASTLFLVTPIKFSGRLIQAIGRALRPAPGKDRARIIDYVDSQVPVLRFSGFSRKRTYREEIVQCQR